jgi:leucyl-tRNA synthetase
VTIDPIQYGGGASPKMQPFLEGKQVVKVVVVPDKLVNIVVR